MSGQILIELSTQLKLTPFLRKWKKLLIQKAELCNVLQELYINQLRQKERLETIITKMQLPLRKLIAQWQEKMMFECIDAMNQYQENVCARLETILANSIYPQSSQTLPSKLTLVYPSNKSLIKYFGAYNRIKELLSLLKQPKIEWELKPHTFLSLFEEVHKSAFHYIEYLKKYERLSRKHEGISAMIDLHTEIMNQCLKSKGEGNITLGRDHLEVKPKEDRQKGQKVDRGNLKKQKNILNQQAKQSNQVRKTVDQPIIDRVEIKLKKAEIMKSNQAATIGDIEQGIQKNEKNEKKEPFIMVTAVENNSRDLPKKEAPPQAPPQAPPAQTFFLLEDDGTIELANEEALVEKESSNIIAKGVSLRRQATCFPEGEATCFPKDNSEPQVQVFLSNIVRILDCLLRHIEAIFQSTREREIEGAQTAEKLELFSELDSLQHLVLLLRDKLTAEPNANVLDLIGSSSLIDSFTAFFQECSKKCQKILSRYIGEFEGSNTIKFHFNSVLAMGYRFVLAANKLSLSANRYSSGCSRLVSEWKATLSGCLKAEHVQSDILSIHHHLKLSPCIARWKKESKRSVERQYAFRELLSTEESYYSDLKKVDQNIRKPLLKGQFIDEGQDRIIFTNFDSIKELSRMYVEELSGMVWKTHNFFLGKKLIGLFSFFSVYEQFMKNYDRARSIIASLLTNPDVRQIERKLAPYDFHNLLGKIQSRPFKYHGNIQRYLKNMNPAHKDYSSMRLAYEESKKMVGKCDAAMSHQQKNTMLLYLDKLFSNVIGEESRYFITDFTAFFFDLPVKAYLLSDMIIVVRNTTQPTRADLILMTRLDSHSYVIKEKNGSYFANKLLLVAKNKAMHFIFAKPEERTRVSNEVRKVIEDMYSNENTRHDKIQQVEKIFRFSRESLRRLSDRVEKNMRQLKNSVQVCVVGQQRRLMSRNSTKSYMIVMIRLSYPSRIHQQVMAEYEDVMTLQKYISEKFKLWLGAPLSAETHEDNELKQYEYRRILLQLFINDLIRSAVKSMDLLADKLRMHEGLWKHINQDCACSACLNQSIITSMKEYQEVNTERVARVNGILRRSGSRTSWSPMENTLSALCPIYSFRLQEQLALLQPDCQFTMEQRLLHVMAYMGKIIHRYAWDVSETQKKTIVELPNGSPIELQVGSRQSVRSVVQMLAEVIRLKDSLDFSLVLSYPDRTYVLADDEILLDLINAENNQPTGLFDKFKSVFSKGEGDPKIRIVLTKVHTFKVALELKSCELDRMRYQLLVDEITERMKRDEVIITINHLKTYLALVYTLIGPREADSKEIVRSLTPASKAERLLDKFYTEVFDKVRDLRSSGIARDGIKIQQLIIQLVGNCCGWYPYMYQMELLEDDPKKKIRVRVGVNEQKLIVKTQDSVASIVDIQLEQLKMQVNAGVLKLSFENHEYKLSGAQAFSLETKIKMYRVYREMYWCERGTLPTNEDQIL